MPSRPKCTPATTGSCHAPSPPADVDARTFALWDLGAISNSAPMRRQVEAMIATFRLCMELKAAVLAMRGEAPPPVPRRAPGTAPTSRPRHTLVSRRPAATTAAPRCEGCGARIGTRRPGEPNLCHRPSCREEVARD